MSDLSAYINFSVQLDKSGITPVIRLTDTSTYPDGVAATVTGVFTATQPDGIAIAGSFTTPDVAYVSGALTACTKELRNATDGNFQNGSYTFTYMVKATGYTDTVAVKTFSLTYIPFEPEIDNLTNVFAPSIQVIDATLWSKAGFTNTITRAWSANISYIGSTIQTVTGTATLFDIIYTGHYYDAHYDISYAATLTYTSAAFTWFSIKDKITSNVQMDAYTPPAITSLANSLAVMKSSIDSGTYCGCGEEEAFEKANALYNTFLQNGQNGLNVYSLYGYVAQLQKIFNCSGILNQAHTNAILTAYNWGTTVSSGDGAHLPVPFKVGSGLNFAPADGATSYINTGLAGLTPKLIFSASIADFLASSAWAVRAGGGFDLIDGSTFGQDQSYTLLF